MIPLCCGPSQRREQGRDSDTQRRPRTKRGRRSNRSEVILELVFDSAVNGRTRLAGGHIRAVDAGDGVARERLKVLRLQGGRVLRLIVDRRAVGEEGRATRRATVRVGVRGLLRAALRDSDEGIRPGETREELRGADGG